MGTSVKYHHQRWVCTTPSSPHHPPTVGSLAQAPLCSDKQLTKPSFQQRHPETLIRNVNEIRLCAPATPDYPAGGSTAKLKGGHAFGPNPIPQDKFSACKPLGLQGLMVQLESESYPGRRDRRVPAGPWNKIKYWSPAQSWQCR